MLHGRAQGAFPPVFLCMCVTGLACVRFLHLWWGGDGREREKGMLRERAREGGAAPLTCHALAPISPKPPPPTSRCALSPRSHAAFAPPAGDQLGVLPRLPRIALGGRGRARKWRACVWARARGKKKLNRHRHFFFLSLLSSSSHPRHVPLHRPRPGRPAGWRQR